MVVKNLPYALTMQISEAGRTRQGGDDLILNKRAFLTDIQFQSSMWEAEKIKFATAPDTAKTELCLDDMIAAREEGKKRKKEVMVVKAGKRS